MRYKQALYIIILLLITSCNSRNEISSLSENAGKVSVEFSLSVSDTQDIYTQTRNSGSLDITSMDVLVFNDQNVFLEKISVPQDEIITTSAGLQFKIQLTASTKKRVIHLIANNKKSAEAGSRINLDILKEKVSLENVMTQLSTANSSSDNLITPIIMWGRVVLNNGIHLNTKVENVQLLRSSASINIQKSATSNNSSLELFRIEGVTLFKASLNGYVLPKDYSGVVTTPKESNPVIASNYFDYNNIFIEGENPTIHLYDRINTKADYISVILKASYKGKSGYYKIALLDGNGDLLHIIRNHKYILTIIDVNSHGYGNIEDAVKFPPTNALKVSLEDKESSYPIVIADGAHIFSASHNEVEVLSSNSSKAEIEVCKIFSSRGVKPEIKLSTLPTWLENIQVSNIGANHFKVTATIANSNSSEEVSYAMPIVCDNLELEVNIKSKSNVNLSQAIPLIVYGDNNKNWSVQVNNNDDIVLSDKNNLSLDNLALDGLPFLSSKFFSNAFLYVKSSKQGLLHSVDLHSVRKEKLVSSRIYVK